MTALADPIPPAHRYERVGALWFVTIDGGLAVAAALALSPALHARAAAAGPVPSRRVLAGIVVGTAVVHAGEVALAHRLATGAGLTGSRGRWMRQVAVVGLPATLRLRAIARDQPVGAAGA